MATILAVAAPPEGLAELAARGHAVELWVERDAEVRPPAGVAVHRLKLKEGEGASALLHGVLGRHARLAPLARAVDPPADARDLLRRRSADVLLLGPAAPRAFDLARAAARVGIPVLPAGAAASAVEAARAGREPPPRWAPLAHPVLELAGRALERRRTLLPRWRERAWIVLAERTAREDPHGRLARAVAREWRSGAR